MSEEDWNPKEQDGMSANIVTIPKDGELRHFFERLRAAGTLTVNDSDREFLVKISQPQISSEAREFLARGGPMLE
jgi:hypothetical protein